MSVPVKPPGTCLQITLGNQACISLLRSSYLLGGHGVGGVGIKIEVPASKLRGVSGRGASPGEVLVVVLLALVVAF